MTAPHRRNRPAAAGERTSLPHLGKVFLHHRGRAQRAWRRYQAIKPEVEPTTAASAHKAWSDAVDDALKTVEAISRARPADLGELLIQFEVCWWWLDMDDNVLDGSTRRWLGRFRRSLRRLATGR